MDFWEYAIFPSSNPQKPPFSLKLELMRMSKFLTATKKNKNDESWIYVKNIFSRFSRDVFEIFSKNIFQDEHFSLKLKKKSMFLENRKFSFFRNFRNFDEKSIFLRISYEKNPSRKIFLKQSQKISKKIFLTKV